MKKALYIVAGLVIGAAFGGGVVLAVNHTIVYTAGQDTTIQTRLIKDYNRRKCFTYGRLAPNCSTAQIVSNGCQTKTVCQAAGLDPGSAGCTQWSTQFVENCVIFTMDAAGEDPYLQEIANQGLVAAHLLTRENEQADIRTQWPLLSTTARDNFCTTAPPNGLGLNAGCTP